MIQLCVEEIEDEKPFVFSFLSMKILGKVLEE